MAIYSKKEFAEMCGMKTNALAIYIKRGQVIVANDNINDSTDVNKTFLQKKQAKLKIKQPAVSTETSTKQNLTADGIPDLSASTKKLKHLDTIKRSREIAKLEIEIAKRRGEVVPAELMKPIVLQHNQSMAVEFKNAIDEFIRIFSKRKVLNVEEIAEIKGESVIAINGAVKRATDATVKSILSVIINHTDKKAVGEHE